MHRRPLIASLGLVAAGWAAFTTACTTTPDNGGAGNTAGTPANMAGTPGAVAGNTGGGGTPGAGGAGQGGVANPTAGSAGAGMAGSGMGGGAACKAVTQVNGSGLTVSAMDINAFKYAPAAGQDMTKMAYDPVGKVVVILGGTNGNMWSFDPATALPTTAMTSPIT